MEMVSYTRMKDMTAHDIELIEADFRADAAKLPERILAAVRVLGDFQGPSRVTRLEHSLQSATRALRDDRPEEYVVAALVHDIGDELAPYSHGPFVASILRPFVSERIAWIIEKHPLFQAYYYAHHIGADRHARDKYKDHPYYADCVVFCERYDQNCFDPSYDSLDLDYFSDMVHRVFKQPKAGSSIQAAY
ncbi:HD domain-containing protein [Actinomadura chibensis]|uniref:Peptidase n=1 Tax=Actinomadura chibensis TaxID=392828 RepID=A0A5D0NXM0_9ACTN|nr:HD domain-containing protein [Actinomadura chibensis]TYB48869.1 peptidase [Actinomadura chibensis]